MTPFVLLAVIALIGFGVVIARRSRARALERLRARWGKPVSRERRMEAIAASHQSRLSSMGSRASLDARTWEDLNLDAVFELLDRSESTLGQHALYHRLRTAPVAEKLEVFDLLVSRFERDTRLAATHDGELVDLLPERYSTVHFGDAVGPDGLLFDYQMKPGPATTRNAIALLRIHGAPQELIGRALACAAALDAERGTILRGR